MTTSRESMNSMLRHEQLPHLVAIATTLNIMKEEIRLNNGELWVSKQQLPASSLTVEETKKTVLVLGEQLKSLSYLEHTSVRRGDFPITDSLMDDAFKILRTEMLDMTAFQEATASPVLVSRGTAAASVAAAAAAAKKNSRKRCYSRVENDSDFTEIPKGTACARLATTRPGTDAAAALPATEKNKTNVQDCRSSGQMDAIVGSAGIFKWQIDNMMDWMKQNDYNPSPGWDAIDDLVEATRMKPSQIVAWASSIGNAVSKLLNIHENQACSTVNDEENVPELTEDNDLVSGYGTGVDAAKPHSAPQDSLGDDLDIDLLESLMMESDFEFAFEDLSPHHHDGQKLSVAFASLTDDELFEDFCLPVDSESEEEAHFKRPSKRARSDSFDTSSVQIE